MTCLPLIANSSRAPQGSGWCRPSMSTIFKNLNAGDENLFHANGILMRLLISRLVDNGFRVEEDDVGEVAFLEESAVVQPQVGCREMRHLADGRFERQKLLLTYILAEHAGEVAVSARMGHRPEKHALGRLGSFVRSEANPWQAHQLADVFLGR